MAFMSATMSSGIRSVAATASSGGISRSHEARDVVEQDVQRFLVAYH
jgi:hypothetical protein